MESAEEFAKRIERQAGECECAECMKSLIEVDRAAVALAVLDELESVVMAASARDRNGYRWAKCCADLRARYQKGTE
jgi:hypothetical protein